MKLKLKTNKCLLYVCLFIVLGLALTGCFSEKFKSNITIPSKTNSEKEKHWEEMTKKVDSITDGLGLKIDAGIKKTVIVLNLLGFTTKASCEGHLDEGLAYPWVDFETENQEIIELNSKLRSILQRIEEEESAIQKKHPDMSLGEALRKENSQDLTTLYGEMHPLNNLIAKTAQSQLVPLNSLIEIFYKNRPANPDRMIIIHMLNSTFLRMYSAGGDWQITRSEQEIKHKLKEYQQEMTELTNFLTDYYFNTSSAIQ
jgi:hypothetical protein